MIMYDVSIYTFIYLNQKLMHQEASRRRRLSVTTGREGIAIFRLVLTSPGLSLSMTQRVIEAPVITRSTSKITFSDESHFELTPDDQRRHILRCPG